jgi:hypothetical protein
VRPSRAHLSKGGWNTETDEGQAGLQVEEKRRISKSEFRRRAKKRKRTHPQMTATGPPEVRETEREPLMATAGAMLVKERTEGSVSERRSPEENDGARKNRQT